MVPLCGSFTISAKHGAKENVCTPRMVTNVAPPCSKCEIRQKGGVSRRDLTPGIVARTKRHHLVAAFYCSAYIYDNIVPGTIRERYANFVRMTYTGYYIQKQYVHFFNYYSGVCFFGHRHCCSTAFSFGLPNTKNESHSGAINSGARSI